MTALDSCNSQPVTYCQNCSSHQLESILFLGHVPPVNDMPAINKSADIELRFPLELLCCNDCHLVQIGYEVDPKILFPESYPYLSGTTKILRDNFSDLTKEAAAYLKLKQQDLVVDIGANDGTLLRPFKEHGCQVLGVEPSQAADVAKSQGITMIKDYFSPESAAQVVTEYGKAKVVTAANVFAHIKDVHEVIRAIKEILVDDGVFISESHYLLDLLNKLQYDTIYHEHLRYYSLRVLSQLFEQHGLEVIKVKRIPTHGGSIRVYTARAGRYPIDKSVQQCLADEDKAQLGSISTLRSFSAAVIKSKFDTLALLCRLKQQGSSIYGISAPSRASTLITFVGINEQFIDCIVEVSGSHKLDKTMPGTKIPVVDEAQLYQQQPDYAFIFSWHIADELIPKLRKQGYQGKFIIPLPGASVISGTADEIKENTLMLATAE